MSRKKSGMENEVVHRNSPPNFPRVVYPAVSYIKFLPESSLGCFFRYTLLVQFMHSVLDVSSVHPCSIVGLGTGKHNGLA